MFFLQDSKMGQSQLIGHKEQSVLDKSLAPRLDIDTQPRYLHSNSTHSAFLLGERIKVNGMYLVLMKRTGYSRLENL